MNSSRSSRRPAWRAAGAGILVVAAAVVAMTALAAATAATLMVARAHLTGPSGKRTELIVVTGRGGSVYWLGGETTRHLLCTSAACLKFWPPVTVAAGAKPKGVGFSGRLGTIRRRGFTQVTLNGHPVYTFLQDGGKRGVATGDGVVAFGGTWHVFKVGAAGVAAGPGSASSGSSHTTTSPSPGY
jgi:predicted lipoprotein with Yx(FWY)xxD motif